MRAAAELNESLGLTVLGVEAGLSEALAEVVSDFPVACLPNNWRPYFFLRVLKRFPTAATLP